MKKFILTVLVVFGLFPLKASAPQGSLDRYTKYVAYQEQLEKTNITKLVMNEIETERTNTLKKLFDSNTILSNTTNKEAIKELSDKLDIQEDWLSLIIYKENRGCTKTPNSLTGAVGIIQWLPSTARALGTSVKELSKMSFTEQLQYVEKYLLYVKAVGRINNYEDLYLSIFFPRALGKDNSYIMGIKPPKNMERDSMSFAQKVYHGNSSIDMNKDGIITVEDFKNFANKI
jgi:hypothetical protein